MKFILLLIPLFTALTSLAQRNQNVYFIKNGQKVAVRDSADFIRIIREPESGKANYELVEYYPDNTLKTVGEVSSFNKNLVYEGRLTSYYKNGTIKSIKNYLNNKLVDTLKTFYTNGNLEEIRFYNKLSKDTVFQMIQIYSKEGSPYLDSAGNGYVKRNLSEDVYTEGNYKGGLKTGTWKEINYKKKIELEEEFVDGVLKIGKAKDEKGKTYKYTKKQELPEFKGGVEAFISFLKEELEYPTEARNKRIQGTVLLSFIVDEVGKISNIKVAKSIYPELDNEAVRVLELSPKWKPGLQNGMPVKAIYTVPVVFTIPRS